MDKYSELELRKFLVRAKRSTYAGDGEYSPASRPGSKDLHYKEGDLLYIDTYFGNADFIGEETVFAEGNAVWAMNYYGRMLTSSIPEGFIPCLKEALKAIPLEFPFRGPEIYENEDFLYKCRWNGSFAGFSGEEEIFVDDSKIYNLTFHGGFIR